MPENAVQLGVVSFDSHNANRIPNLNSERSSRYDTAHNYYPGYHMTSSGRDSENGFTGVNHAENPIINFNADIPIMRDEDTAESSAIGMEPKISSATVIEFPLQRRVTRMSVLGWLARGLPLEARKKLRSLLNNLKEICPELYDEVIVDSQEFTRAELLAWLDIVGDIVPPEGTDIDALMAAELD